MKKPISSKHLESVSDLTLIAPIKKGFVDAFEGVTYETRLRLLLKALFKIRSTAREHSMIKPYVDTAERIQSLLDFRLAVLDTEPRQLMLSATFDRPFEPYMRLIWDPLGPLLDVIFCNCEGYVTASDHSFEDYLAWVRSAQIDSDFFYSMSGHSVSDVQYALKIERLQREKERQSGTAVYVGNPERDARKVRGDHPKESQFLGLEALVALYRLTDFYPPDDPDGDGELLRRATQQLLRGFAHKDRLPLNWDRLIPEQLAWFRRGLAPGNGSDDDESERLAAAEAIGRVQRLECDPMAIQGGIIDGFEQGGLPIRHGVLLLMRIVDPERARAFLRTLKVSDGAADQAGQAQPYFLNLALTWRGLARLGLPDADLARFPQEFREGMEERAGLLGDLRASHPRRWLPPVRNWPAQPGPGHEPDRIDLTEVDLVLQLRTWLASEGDLYDVHQPGHPLAGAVSDLAKAAADSGVELIAIETMRRAQPDSTDDPRRDHFGFRDGISQPSPVPGVPDRFEDQVTRGEILWGYPNDRSDPPPAPSVFIDNGSFLAVRKLRQHVGRLRAFADAKHPAIDREILYGKMVGRLRSGHVMAVPNDSPTFNKFVYGPDEDGERCPFQAHIRRANPRAQREGQTERPSPRILRRGLSYGPPAPAEEGVTTAADARAIDADDRGTMFMAYGASLAEQYEVIQRWVNSGNSTGVGSWLTDPLMGVGRGEEERVFRFRYYPPPPECERGRAGGAADATEPKWGTKHVKLSEPFVELQWGLYLFVPSVAAIRAIADLSPVSAQEQAAARERGEIEKGERIIARLAALADTGPHGKAAAADGWKACLEDFHAKDPGERADGPAVWAAIRANHGGALRVPYGAATPGGSPPEVVLVGSKDLVMRVFSNPDCNYSMLGQMARMKQSFGPIFLGLDPGTDYDEKAEINRHIQKIGEPAAFAVAYQAADGWLNGVLRLFSAMGLPDDLPNGTGVWGELDLRRDFVTPVLGAICNFWFGIPDTLTPADSPQPSQAEPHAKDRCPVNHVDLGGWGWDPVRKPRCPGDFLSTSRYCFYPDPAPRVQAYGKAHGQALRKAVRAHFEAVRSPTAPVAAAMAGIPVFNDDRDEFARTIIGIMTGFLPPTDASLRWTLYDWLEEKEFWRLQNDLRRYQPGADDLVADDAFGAGIAGDAARLTLLQSGYARSRVTLLEPLFRAMQKRPSPDMLWRTSVRGHKLGHLDVEDGDRVFIGIVSAMAEDAKAGVTDVYPVFGGNRSVVPHPQHACPAYRFAIGTMLGILGALMDAVRLEALPAPLLVRIRPATRPRAPASARAPSGS